MDNLQSIISHMINLKYIQRYKNTRTSKKDTSGAHSYSVIALAHLFYSALDLNIDLNKSIKMAIVHDLVESVTDDIDYRLVHDKLYSEVTKKNNEDSAMELILKDLPENLKNEYFDLWNEFEEQKTPESKYILALDKLETYFNSYHLGHDIFDHSDIIMTRADSSVKNFPPLVPVLGYIKLQMKKRFNELNIEWKPEYNFGLEE